MNRPLWTYTELDEKTLLRLKSHGFQTKTDVETNIEDAQKVCENIQDVIFNEKTHCVWQSGLEVLKKEEEKVCVTTLSKYLDELLNGGIELGKLTEIYGNAGSGKTQLCLQLAINVSLPKVIGGLEGESLYIETSKSVFPSRLTEMIDAFVEHVKLNLELREQMKSSRHENKSNTTLQSKTSVVDGKNANELVDKQTCSKQSIEARCKSPDLNDSVGNISSFSELLQDKKFASDPDNSCINNIFKRKRKRDGSLTEPNGLDEKLELGSCYGVTRRETSNSKSNNLLQLDPIQTETKSETPGREFKINMTRTDLDKLISQSKKSNTNLNTFLQDKLNSSFVTKSSEITRSLVRSKIHVHYCSNYFETLALLMNAERALKRNKNAFKLIVVDNITFLFHNADDSNYLKRTKNVYFLLDMLSTLATNYNLAIVLVNQLTTKYISSNQTTSCKRQVIPALGETFSHRIQTRLFLQKFSWGLLSSLGESSQVIDETDNMYMCLLDKMVVHNELMGNKKHVLFQINQHGVRDV